MDKDNNTSVPEALEGTHTKTEKVNKAVAEGTRSVPQLRFAEFDGEWNKTTINKISNKVTDGTHDTPKTSNEGVPYLTAIHVKDGFIDFDNCYYLPQIEHDKIYKRCNPELEDLLMVNIGAGTANTASVNVEYEFSLKNVALIKPNHKLVVPQYLSHVQRKNSARLRHQLSSGGAQPFLSLKEIGKLKLNIPTLPEQQKIARFLTAVDTKLQQLTRKKELLQQYKKGVMQQLFPSTGSGQVPKLRFKPKQNDSVAECHNEPVEVRSRSYPDWEEKKLGEIAVRVAVKNVANEVNFVLTNSATQGIVSQHEYFERDIANQNNLQGYYIVSKDDFVYNPRISMSAPVGPIKRNKLQKGVMSPLYSVFRFSEPLLEYFEHYFETINWHRYLHSVANFGARHDRMNITNSDFFKMPIPMPCLEERQQITSYLAALDTKIEQVTEALEATQQFKKGLLQQLFV